MSWYCLMYVHIRACMHTCAHMDWDWSVYVLLISYEQSQYWNIFQKRYNYIDSIFAIAKFHHNSCNCTSSSNSIYRYERSRGSWIKSIWADDYSGVKVVSLWVLHVPTNPGKDMWKRWCFVIFNLSYVMFNIRVDLTYSHWGFTTWINTQYSSPLGGNGRRSLR